MASGPAIHWFRQDLRLADNHALAAAATDGRPVIAVYILDDEAGGAWAPGGASRWWLHGSLAALDGSLRSIGSRLTLRRGDTMTELLRLARETGATSIHCTRAYEPFLARQEREVKNGCSREGLDFKRYCGNLLTEPESVRTIAGEPFRVFTPFWRALCSRSAPQPPCPAPEKLAAPAKPPKSDKLEAWALRPSRPDWAGGLRTTWTPGEVGAERRLERLVDHALQDYERGRDRPDQLSTSMLSPHLHFGEISPAQCWYAVRPVDAKMGERASEAGAASFLREIGWREFSYHLLHQWPTITERAFRPEFEAFPWLTDQSLRSQRLAAWSGARTGYPIVDAGMRQLWQTGWMHNRVRMITASFLTKHLLVPWQEGSRWFWDTLVDADLASNSASWQWVAGSGADAAPYFRIFNPMLQGEKFDPDGDYVRRFVPELGALPTRYLHAPWMAPANVLADARIVLDTTYPRPIVDHAEARQTAMRAYSSMKDGPATTKHVT